MKGLQLLKHFNEFQRYVRNYKFEFSDTGIYFPTAHAWMRGTYEHWLEGYESDLRVDCNIIPIQSQNYFLTSVFVTPASAVLWYLGLHSASSPEDSAVTAATYNATYSEIQAQSGDPGGYSSATRIAWANDAVDTVNSEITNDATPAAFTVSTTTTLVVNGAWMTNKSGRTDYTGTAMSIAKFSATRNLADTDVFNLKYKIDLDHV